MFLVICVATNFLGVKYYGEIEFWFACLKVTMLFGLIIFGIIANVGGINGGQSQSQSSPSNTTFFIYTDFPPKQSTPAANTGAKSPSTTTTAASPP